MAWGHSQIIPAINLQGSIYKHASTDKLVYLDPYQLASMKIADLDVHCFQTRIYPG